MLEGPLQIGWRVAVSDGSAVACATLLDGWVDDTTELELDVPSGDRVETGVLETRGVELAVTVA
jgi:hypothetical protein